jgi:hypothetical protein
MRRAAGRWLAMQKDRWPLRLPCPLLTCFRFEDGAQLRRSSPELFGRCQGPFSSSKYDCAGLTARYDDLLKPGTGGPKGKLNVFNNP